MYVAFDLDAIDASGGWAVAMPERGGLVVGTALAASGVAAPDPIVGFGATAVMLGRGGDAERTVDAVAALAEAALGT